jgi:hypothetical protein
LLHYIDEFFPEKVLVFREEPIVFKVNGRKPRISKFPFLGEKTGMVQCSATLKILHVNRWQYSELRSYRYQDPRLWPYPRQTIREYIALSSAEERIAGEYFGRDDRNHVVGYLRYPPCEFLPDVCRIESKPVRTGDQIEDFLVVEYFLEPVVVSKELRLKPGRRGFVVPDMYQERRRRHVAVRSPVVLALRRGAFGMSRMTKRSGGRSSRPVIWQTRSIDKPCGKHSCQRTSQVRLPGKPAIESPVHGDIHADKKENRLQEGSAVHP